MDIQSDDRIPDFNPFEVEYRMLILRKPRMLQEYETKKHLTPENFFMNYTNELKYPACI